MVRTARTLGHRPGASNLVHPPEPAESTSGAGKRPLSDTCCSRSDRSSRDVRLSKNTDSRFRPPRPVHVSTLRRFRSPMRPLARIVVVLGLVASMLALTAPAASAYSGSAASAESEFLTRLNATRAGAGLHSLVLNPALSNYARLWST